MGLSKVPACLKHNIGQDQCNLPENNVNSGNENCRVKRQES